ncbi:MAG: hypothetical protein JST26_11750 [Bacteroidetes bacterium]|nr:hypothetical protein [Bacteroidota bacterium]
MKKQILFILIGLWSLSCRDKLTNYIAYAKFDEYRMSPENQIDRSDPKSNYILVKKGNGLFDIIMPSGKHINFKKKSNFWYYYERSGEDLGTGGFTTREEFVFKDTIYALETNFSQKKEIEWQGLTMKTRGENFYFSLKEYIDDLTPEGKFKGVVSIVKAPGDFDIILKERHSDTLLSYWTNNEKFNLRKKCIYSVVILDNLDEFGQNDYPAKDITPLYLEKHPALGNCDSVVYH